MKPRTLTWRPVPVAYPRPGTCLLLCPILLPQLHPSFQTCSFQHGTQTHPSQARVWLHIPRALPDVLLCPPLMEQVATLLSTNIAPSLQVPGPLPAALGITIPEGGFFFLPPPEFVTLSTFPDRFIVLSQFIIFHVYLPSLSGDQPGVAEAKSSLFPAKPFPIPPSTSIFLRTSPVLHILKLACTVFFSYSFLHSCIQWACISPS